MSNKLLRGFPVGSIPRGGAVMRYPGTPSTLLNNLQIAWNLQEDSGTATDAIHGYALTESGGTIGAAAGPSAAIPKARLFSGSDYLTIASNSDLQAGSDSFTISSWVYQASAVSNAQVWGKRSGTSDEWYMQILSNPLWRLVSANGSKVVAESTVNVPVANTWFSVVMWYDSAAQSLNLQINNGAIRTTTGVTTITNSDGPFSVGAAGAGISPLVGRVAALYKWSRVLTIDERAELYNSGAGKLYPFDAGSTRQWFFGAWTWFNDPRAVRVNAHTIIGAIDHIGDVGVTTYDHTNHKMTLPEINLARAFEIDDHDNPAFIVRASDGKIMAWYSKHSGTVLNQHISANAAPDVSAWGAAANIRNAGMDNVAYANPFQLTGEANNPIYLFFRGFTALNQYSNYYMKSTDEGATWGVPVRWNSNGGSQRPYVKYSQNGNSRIDFFVSEGNPSETSTCSLYHCYYQGDKFYTSAGVEIVGLPIALSSMTQVYNGATIKGWCWDIVIDGSGNPVVVYATFPNTNDHRYNYAKWNGVTWTSHEICTAGTYLYAAEPYYSGGVVIDPTDINTIYCSRESGGNWQVWRYVTTDSGTTWTGTQLTNGVKKSIRPYVARNAGTTEKVFYLYGDYTSYTNYALQVTLLI